MTYSLKPTREDISKAAAELSGGAPDQDDIILDLSPELLEVIRNMASAILTDLTPIVDQDADLNTIKEVGDAVIDHVAFSFALGACLPRKNGCCGEGGLLQ